MLSRTEKLSQADVRRMLPNVSIRQLLDDRRMLPNVSIRQLLDDKRMLPNVSIRQLLDDVKPREHRQLPPLAQRARPGAKVPCFLALLVQKFKN